VVGWIGLLGKAISFMVGKITSKKIDLSFDQRRKAARQFLGLYQALGDLEVLTRELIVELRYMCESDDPSVSAEWLREASLTVDETSQRFLEATLGLCDVLDIFDPLLSHTVCALEAHKFSFLLIAAQGFEPAVQNGQITEVRYTEPGARASELDLERTYRWYADRYPLDTSRPLEWPEDVLLGFVNEDDYNHDRLTMREPESIVRFANLLENHLHALTLARTELASLLRAKFSIEDLLAVQAPVDRFDRMHVNHRMSDSSRVPYVRMFAGRPARRIPPPEKE